MTTYRTFTATITELGTMTDDYRMLAAGMDLSFRTFPLALRWQETADPGHDHAYTVGVIENAALEGAKVVATGYLLNTPEADTAADQIEHGVTRPSVDLGAATSIYTDEAGNEVDLEQWFESGDDVPLVETVTAGKVLGATLVSIAAFDRPTDITMTGTREIDDQAVTTLVASLTPIVAAGERRFADDFRPRRELFANPNLTGYTHPTYDEETGRVFGHVAPWGKTHIGFAGKRNAPEAPRSNTGYSYFHTSRLTAADNEPVMVGKLTVATGHADLRLAAGPAAEHYDNTGSCWAYVCCGEDRFGIWFSGVLHPSAGDEMVRDGLASPLSGDWRPIGAPGERELVAALSVNTPGFPLVASATDDDGQGLALVAALAPRRIALNGDTTMATPPPPMPAKTPPADKTAPADKPADVKFPEGTTVKVKDSDAEGTVDKALTEQTVYQVGDTWYLEEELEAVAAPADTPPAVAASIAAAVADELDRRASAKLAAASTKAAITKVMGIRTDRARKLIATTKAGQ